MKEIFIFQESATYSLRSCNHLVQNIQTTQHGIKSVSNFGAKIWGKFFVLIWHETVLYANIKPNYDI